LGGAVRRKWCSKVGGRRMRRMRRMRRISVGTTLWVVFGEL